MTTPALTAREVFDAQRHGLLLTWVAGHNGSDRLLEPPSARYPGMALVGHLNLVHPNRVQVIGANERRYLDSLDSSQRQSALAQMAGAPSCAMFVVADDVEVSAELKQLAEHHGVALLSSPLPSPQLIDALQHYLTEALAERIIQHGVFMEVMGIGVLITGESGIGKSEVALELLSRNHRLVADDAVEFARIAPNLLEGCCPEALRDFMEVRGLGILNIRAMFGETAIKRRKYLRLIVRLERMTIEQMAKLDRLQATKRPRRIVGVDVPEVVLPVAPGRNLAVLIEAAVRQHVQHMRGDSPLEALMNQQQSVMRRKKTAGSTGDDHD